MSSQSRAILTVSNYGKSRVRLVKVERYPDRNDFARNMGEAVLSDFPAVLTVHLSLPNKHCLPVDLKPFGLDNPNEVFLPVDEPHGLIEATLSRSPS